jgi:hypothetical protein
VGFMLGKTRTVISVLSRSGIATATKVETSYQQLFWAVAGGFRSHLSLRQINSR